MGVLIQAVIMKHQVLPWEMRKKMGIWEIQLIQVGASCFGYVCKRINDKINCFSCPERGKIIYGNSWDQVFLRDQGSKFTAILGSGIKKLGQKTGSV